MSNINWTAIFKDKSELSQIDEEGKEHLFKEVQEKMSDLSFFILKYNKNDNYYIVDIHKGLIYINKIQDPEAEFISDKFNIRLIYFRRNRVHMDNNYKEIDRDIIHFLGYQYLDKVGKNHKVIIQISNEGNILIGG
jgi:hypothetical protein